MTRLGKDTSTRRLNETTKAKLERITQLDTNFLSLNRVIIDDMFDAVYIHSLDGKLLEANSAACRRIGRSRGELVNKEKEELVSLRLVGSMPEYIELTKRDGEITFESVSLTAAGDLIPVEVRSKLITYQGEEAVLTFSRDLREQRKREASERGRLEALQRHAVNLSRLYSILDVAEYSFDIIDELLRLVKGTIGVVEGDCIKFVFARGLKINRLPVLPLNGRGITVRAVNTGETQLVADTRLDPDFVSDIDGPVLLSELDVPVKLNGKVAAVINLQAEEEDAFTEEDKKIVEILSEHVSSAMARIEYMRNIKRSEEKWRKLLESSLDSVMVLTGTTITYVNRRLASMLDYSDPSELVGQEISVTLPPDERDRVRGITLSRQRGERQPDSYELRLLTKTGRIIDVEAAVSTTEFEGKPAVVSFARDVTQRHRYEQQIMSLHHYAVDLHQASTWSEVVEATLDAIEEVNGCHLISYLEKRAGGLISIGSRGSLTIGRPLPLDGKGITVKAAREMRTILVNDTRRSPDFVKGTQDSLSELAVPVIHKGIAIGVINLESTSLDSFSDLDVKTIETLAQHISSKFDRLEAQRATLEHEAEKTKELLKGADRIIGMVRHDLRGPLQSIRTANYLMKLHPERAEELTQTIDDSVDYASKMLEDLKEMTKPSEFQPIHVFLEDIIDQSLEDFSLPKNVKVVRKYGRIPEMKVDPFRMRRVIDNLVKNAVEAMPDGGDLTLETIKKDGLVEVRVGDTGAGLSTEAQANLFKPFYTTKKTGTGLGLSICKQAVEMHGGSIVLKSELGKGTVVTVILPL